MKLSRSLSIIFPISIIGISLIFTPLLGGCGKHGGDDRLLITIVDDDSPPPSENPDDADTVPAPSPTDSDTTLRIGCWEDFFPGDILDAFEDESGIAVEIIPPSEPFDPIDLFSNHGDEYDLVLVDDFIITELMHRGDLSEVDHSRVPNFDNIDPLFLLHPTDTGRYFSVPITFGTLGILVNRNLVTETDIDWDILFDARYSGLIDMPFEHFILFVPPLKNMGYSINERNPDILEDACDLLRDQKKIIRGYFDHDQIITHLARGTSAVAYAWSWAEMGAVDMGGNVEYVVPKSGTLLWSDCLVVPRESFHKSEAEAFLNFLLTPDNMAHISDHLWTANTVRTSWDRVNPALRDMEEIFIPEQTLFNSEYLEPFGPESEEILMELTDELFNMDGVYKP